MSDTLYITEKNSSIQSHIPSWMSNLKVEQQLKRLNRIISERQKKLGEWK